MTTIYTPTPTPEIQEVLDAATQALEAATRALDTAEDAFGTRHAARNALMTAQKAAREAWIALLDETGVQVDSETVVAQQRAEYDASMDRLMDALPETDL